MGFGRADHNRIHSGEADVFTKLFAEVDAFIDVGANIGIYSLLASQRKIPCIAMEPSPYNFRHLLENFAVNGASGVEAFNMAICGKPGWATLYGDGEMASVRKGWGGVAETITTRVAANTLDNLCAHRFPDKRLLIKVDVEGHEMRVLEGACALLARQPAPLWIVEHACDPDLKIVGEDPFFRHMLDQSYAILPLRNSDSFLRSHTDLIPAQSDSDFLFSKDPDNELLTQLKLCGMVKIDIPYRIGSQLS